MVPWCYLPMGWVVPFSMAAATARASFSQLGIQHAVIFEFLFPARCPYIGSIALNTSFPVVNVPVLSNAMVWHEARASSTCPPFSNIPYSKKKKKKNWFQKSRKIRYLRLQPKYTFLAQELIAVAYVNGATAKAHGDAATMSPNALYTDPLQAVRLTRHQSK